MRYEHRRLRRARLDAKLTAAEVARRAGVQLGHWKGLEAGVYVPNAGTLAKIASATGKAIGFFYVKQPGPKQQGRQSVVAL